jgi:hypothetical protein
MAQILFKKTSSIRGRLKCDDTRAKTRFRLSAKRTSPFKSGGGASQFSRLLAAEVCASAVVMLGTPCSEVVWRLLATHSIRQFPLQFSSRASPCDMTFQPDSTFENSWRRFCSSGDESLYIRKRSNVYLTSMNLNLERLIVKPLGYSKLT